MTYGNQITANELFKQYENVPLELKNLRRWVCFKVEERNGQLGKFPINAINGKYAKSNDSTTWTSFKCAINGCEKYKCNGIGFMLGDGIFGVDLDNHPNKETGELEMPQEEFDKICDEFISKLDSYAEKSFSGLGVHIICSGKLPEGRRKTNAVEMYENGRFFAFTGNVIHYKPIENREEEIKELFDKYMPKPIVVERAEQFVPNNATITDLSIREIIEVASNSKNGDSFQMLYRGNYEQYLRMTGAKDTSHSSGDMAFATMLVFWCNHDLNKADQIFRMSGMMRDKWDREQNGSTYGAITLANADRMVANGYVKYEQQEYKPTRTITIGGKKLNYSNDTGEIEETPAKEENNAVQAQKEPVKQEEIHPTVVLSKEPEMNIDENGEPIFRIKMMVNKRYTNDDTGNAKKFYDYFGKIFKYNTTDKKFMFWTGKVWIKDEKEIIRKYANKLIEINRSEIFSLRQELSEKQSKGEDTETLEKYINAFEKNISRISNKSGKDAMLSEFQALNDIPVTNADFNNDDYLLNTQNGVVDMRTGAIKEFDPKYMQSKITKSGVSYEEPKVFLKFLRGIFERKNSNETEEIITCMQKCLGYSALGITKEQCMFLMYGNGSNGKSTFSECITGLLNDYADNVRSDVLMQKGAQQNIMSTLAKLKDIRFVETGETDEGGKLAEGTVKNLTGDTRISARFLYGQEFTYLAKYKIWMSTNNRPIIKGTDDGIWRRMFVFPFIRSFSDEEKDKNLPEKLEKEYPAILGWIIQGSIKYLQNYHIEKPECLKQEIRDYKKDMDTVATFIAEECEVAEDRSVDVDSMFNALLKWGIENKMWTPDKRKFRKSMKDKGFKEELNNRKPYFKGIYVPALKF